MSHYSKAFHALPAEDQDKLHEAFNHLVKLREAGADSNHSTCVSFQCPINGTWNKEVATEIAASVRIYVDTWILGPLEEIFGFDSSFMAATMKKEKPGAAPALAGLETTHMNPRYNELYLKVRVADMPARIATLLQCCRLVSDGDLISKSDASFLNQAGLIHKTAGWNIVTIDGLQMLDKLGLIHA